MSKPERKSVASLLSAAKAPARKPSAEEIDKITNEIHQPSNDQKVKNKPVQASGEMTKRISINAPVELYLKAKTKSTMQRETLMDYVIRLIEADNQ